MDFSRPSHQLRSLVCENIAMPVRSSSNYSFCWDGLWGNRVWPIKF